MRRLAFAVVCLVTLSGTARADVTTYTNSAAFFAALGGTPFTTETYDGYAVNTLIGTTGSPTGTLGPLTYSFSSPTFGGGSWLAHASFMSGVEVRDTGDYTLLLTQRRETWPKLFEAAGYRAVAVMPGLRSAWPEGAFYGFDTIYDALALDYRGPDFGWWRIPDQFSLARTAEQLRPALGMVDGARTADVVLQLVAELGGEGGILARRLVGGEQLVQRMGERLGDEHAAVGAKVPARVGQVMHPHS